jgi:thioredoxin 1
MLKTFTQAGFATDVLQSDKPVVVDFSAHWCPPCRMLAPLVERLATDLASSHVVGTVDIDDQPGLAEAYGVTSIPTLLLFRDGQAVGRATGFRSAPELARFAHGPAT